MILYGKSETYSVTGRGHAGGNSPEERPPMFEITMLLGFVYAGFCCFFPERRTSSRIRWQDVFTKP
jgi:hypothetical protein